jgi:hypothetical protein
MAVLEYSWRVRVGQDLCTSAQAFLCHRESSLLLPYYLAHKDAGQGQVQTDVSSGVR